MTTHLLDTPAGRLRAAAALARNRAVLGALGLTGDPVARVLRGSPRTDTYAAYEQVRRLGDLAPSRVGVLAVSSYPLTQQVLRDPRFGVRPAGAARSAADVLALEAGGPLAGSFLELDPPDHTRLRRVAAPAFRPRVVRDLTADVDGILRDLLDRAVPRGRVDLMAALAAPFPIAVISRLLGVPAEETVRFRRIGVLVGQSLDGVRTVREATRLRAASAELEALFRRLAAQRRADPRDDVISRLVAAEDDDLLVASDLVATCGLLLVAGFETTVNLIGNGVAALLGTGDRGRWAALATDPGLAARVTEETLRFDSPVQLTARVAHQDAELGGQRVRAGTWVLALLAAANRDPATFGAPATFDPDRQGEPEHLAFSSGIHYCLGAPLARLEGELAFRALAERAPRLRLLPRAVRRRGATVRGYARLPVAFD